MTTLDSDLAVVAPRLSGAANPLTFTLLSSSGGSELDDRLEGWFRSWCDAAGGAVPCDRIQTADAVAPAVRIADGSGRELTFAVVPDGPEAAPFLEAVSQLSGIEKRSMAPWEARLKELEDEVELLVFVTPQCPHCPQQVRQAIALALASAKVRLTVIDAEMHTELAVAHQARSVPLTVIDHDLGLVGAVAAETMVEHIFSRGDAVHDRAVLFALIESGRAADTAVKLAERSFREAFAELWSASVLSSRMAMMLVIEEVLEQQPDCLDDIVDKLLPLLESDDSGLRGDTVDLLAAIAHPDAGQALEELIDDPDEDVADAAEEALANISARFSSCQLE